MSEASWEPGEGCAAEGEEPLPGSKPRPCSLPCSHRQGRALPDLLWPAQPQGSDLEIDGHNVAWAKSLQVSQMAVARD